MAFLEKMEAQYPKLKLPCWWRVGDTLRYAYSNNFKLEKTIEVKIRKKNLTRKFRKSRISSNFAILHSRENSLESPLGSL